MRSTPVTTRLAAIAASLAIVLSFGLAACGGGDETTTTSTTSTGAIPDPAEAFAKALVADGYADDQKVGRVRNRAAAPLAQS